MTNNISIGEDDALIIIDIQNDFCPAGSLPVPDGDKIIAPVNQLSDLFDNVVISQDWHPAGHSSFASSHNEPAYQTVKMPYGEQMLWPDHCISGSEGADFHPELAVVKAQLVVRKGFRPHIDSYSAFFENDKTTTTGLAGYLRERRLERIFLVGLVFEFCVGYTALDGCNEGFEVYVIEDATGTFGGEGQQMMRAQLTEAGASLITVSDMLN